MPAQKLDEISAQGMQLLQLKKQQKLNIQWLRTVQKEKIKWLLPLW